MKKLMIACILSFAALGASAQEAKKPFEPLGYPGYTWGNITFPSSLISGPENNNVLLQGKVEQGIDWFKLGDSKNVTLNTFVDVGYSLDNEKMPWNNKVTPGIGIKLKHNASFAQFEYGIRYGYEHRWEDPINNSGSGVQVFVNWYSNWNLRR